MTTVFGVNAGYEHFWNKRWQTSLYGTWLSTSYNATANALLCQGEFFALAAGCNNLGLLERVGSRTQFNIDSQTYVGLDDYLYQLHPHDTGVLYFSGSGAQPVTTRTITDQSAWIAEFRHPSQLLSLIV